MMDATMMLAALGGVGFLIIAYLLLDSGDSTTKKRVQKISGSSKEKRSALSFMKVDDNSSRRKQIESSLEELEKKQKSKNKKKKSLKSKMIQANLTMTARTFSIISISIGVVVALILILMKINPLFALAGGFVVGFGLPRWFLNMLITRRQQKFSNHFADAMDIIVRGVRTGLPLNDCLSIIAHETPEPVRSEFQKLVEAERVGVPLGTCVEQMYERMPLAEVNFFGTVLSIQRSTGGNLGESLDNLSNVLRGRKILREKVKALAAEAKTSAIIIGLLPPAVMIMVSIVQPDYMALLYHTPRGQKNLMIGAGMMLTGILTMRKMINFKF